METVLYARYIIIAVYKFDPRYTFQLALNQLRIRVENGAGLVGTIGGFEIQIKTRQGNQCCHGLSNDSRIWG
jgi:hypothetical protein